MSCQHCVRAVEEVLREFPGVESFSVEIGRAQVLGSPDFELLIAALAEDGYLATQSE